MGRGIFGTFLVLVVVAVRLALAGMVFPLLGAALVVAFTFFGSMVVGAFRLWGIPHQLSTLSRSVLPDLGAA